MMRFVKPTIIIVVVAALIAGPWIYIESRDEGTTTPVAATLVEDRELVVQYLKADGTINRTQLVDSLTVAGEGTVAVTDVAEHTGFRNLRGFSGPSFDGNEATWQIAVSGQKEILTNADAQGVLPVTVQPKYFLNGKEVEPGDLVGKDGRVRVEFALANVSEQTEDLTFIGPNGIEVTEPVTTYLPLVAQVQLELPASMWSNLEVVGGRVITDDNGIHHLSFAPLLAPIIGNVNQTVAIEGDVEGFELGMTRIVVLPLAPPGADNARTSAEGAMALYEGLGEVDANLLLLRDGSVELMEGLTTLQAGIVEANSGVGTVGAEDTIVDGLSQMLAGLKQLGDATEGLPAAQLGIAALTAGIKEVVAGLGTTSTDGTVLGGLADLKAGISLMRAGIGTTSTDDTILGGLFDVRAGINSANAGLGTIAATIGGAVGAPTTPGAATSARNDNAFVAGLIGGAVGVPVAPDATTSARNDAAFMTALSAQAVAACDGYATALGQPTCSTLFGAGTFAAIGGGIEQKLAGARSTTTTAIEPKLEGSYLGITTQVQPGLTLLSAGVTDLIAGVKEVKAGLTAASAGTGELIAGVKEIKTGLNRQVLAGLEQLGEGVAAAVAGIGTVGTAGTLTDGADRLFAGSQDLADGLGLLSDGAAEAAAGAGTIADGQTRLSTEGTQRIRSEVAAGGSTASQALAVLNAMTERATEGQFLYGPPADAAGSAAYVYEIAGIDARNLATAVKTAVAIAFVVALAIVARYFMRHEPMPMPV